MIVAFVLGFYITVCISVVLFNIWIVCSDRVLHAVMTRRMRRFRALFSEKLLIHKEYSPHAYARVLRRYARKLRTDGQLMAFQNAMDAFAACEPEEYASQAPMLAELVEQALPVQKKKKGVKQAYYTYLITHFHVMKHCPTERMLDFLFEQIRENKSLYNLENALRAVYSYEKVEPVLEALALLNGSTERAIHEKLVIDGLLTFSDRDGLIRAIWERFDRYAPAMKELLLDYIRFASGAWGDKMTSLLESTKSKEEQIACIRYFGKYPSEAFREKLYALTESSLESEWEIANVCMTVLSSYPGGRTLEYLKRGVCNRSWYVRYNAAMSLKALHVSEVELSDILCGNDRYAREMLCYRLGYGAPEEPVQCKMSAEAALTC